MKKKIMLTSALAILGLVLTVAVYSSGAVSPLASVNLVGALAAAFAAVVGFVWFLRNR